MYKDKRSNYKKTYVRNTELNKPRTVIINEQDVRSELSEKPTYKNSDTKNPNGNPVEQVAVNLNIPNINSSLMIAKKMKDIENVRPQKTEKVLKSQDKKILVDEMVGITINILRKLTPSSVARMQINFNSMLKEQHNTSGMV